MYAWADRELPPAEDVEDSDPGQAGLHPSDAVVEDPMFVTAAALETRLGRALPPRDGSAVDCVFRLRTVWRELSDGPAVSRDDFTVGTRRPEEELAADLGGDWHPLNGAPEDVAPLLEHAGPGSTAFLLSYAEHGPGHAFALRNEDGHLFWLETQAGPGARVYPFDEGPPVPAGDVRVIVAGPDRRAVPFDTLSKAPATVDALRLAPDDLTYGAQGREHELEYLVHAHADGVFRNWVDRVLIVNRATGVSIETDTTDVWVAGGRYFSSERAALAARRGRVRQRSAKIIEISTLPERVLATGEVNRYDPAVVEAGIRDVVRRLNRAVRLRNGAGGPGDRGTSLRELFGDDPDYVFEPEADDVSILIPPGFTGRIYTQITDGVPLTFSLPFLQATRALGTYPRLGHYLRAGTRFGDDMTMMFLDHVMERRVGRFAGPALEFVPDVTEIRAAMTLLNTHAYGVARVFLGDKESLAKNLIHGVLRTALAGVRESMRPNVRDYLEEYRDRIRARLGEDLTARLDSAIRRYEDRRRRAGRRPLPLFEYQLTDRDKNLGQYVDNLLLPADRLDVFVDQDAAMNVRTNFRRPDTNGRRLPLSLLLFEMRDVGRPVPGLGRAEHAAGQFSAAARRAYELAERVARNSRTPEGRAYNTALVEAVRTVDDYRPPGSDLATDVRDFLDAVARHAPDAVRDPVFEGNVTTTLQARAVVALREFIESPHRVQALAVREAVAAIRDAVVTRPATVRSGHGNLADLRRRGDRLLRYLRRHSHRYYPDPEYVNDATTVPPAPAARTDQPRWHEVRGADGRDVGKAYFSDKDWKPRSSFYGELAKLSFRSWPDPRSGRGGALVEMPVEVPVGDAGKVYVLAGHGSQLTDPAGQARATAREIVGRGFTTLYLLRCVPETGTDVGGLRQVSRDFNLTIVEGTGPVAPAPDAIHLLPDAARRAGGVRVYRPDGAVTRRGAGPEETETVVDGVPRTGRAETGPPRDVSWHADVVLHEVRDEDGRFRGLASYGPKDMVVRAPAMTRASSLTTYTAWHADGAEGGVVPTRRPMPGGEAAFHWFSHGTAGRVTAATRGGGSRSLDGDELIDLIESRLGDATDIVLWSCQTGSAVDRRATLELATRVGERTGRRTHVAEWETALDHDLVTGDASAHTYADPDGGETGWISVSPRTPTSSGPGGVLVEVPVLPEEGETFGRALERALNRGASLLPVPDGATVAGTTAYDRFVAGLTEDDLPASAPLADETAQVHVDDLARTGIELTAAQRTQAVLQNGRLSVASLGLDRLRRFRLAMEMRSAATEEMRAELTAALEAVARRLGLRIVLGEAVPAGGDRPVLPRAGLRNAPTDTGRLPGSSYTPTAADRRAGRTWIEEK
jgi:hypothetical protein